ncbi:MAG: glycosyltransferase [Elusimicrobiales bacterium]|nr:glycosyltransferase [Elusimicrobiales bacterium]
MNGKISVIIPAHNAGGTLRECLAACRSCKTQPAEIIVVDDGSGDATAELAKRMGAKLLSLAKPSGAAAARNEGARVSGGDILVFMDADVLPCGDWLGEILRSLGGRAGIDAVQGVYDPVCLPATLPGLARNFYKCYNAAKLADGALISGINSYCFAVRRAAFENIRGFDSAAERAEDVDLGRRLAGAGHKILLNKRVRVRHLKTYSFAGLLACDFRKVLVKTGLFLAGAPGADPGVTFSLNKIGAMSRELGTMALSAAALAALVCAPVTGAALCGLALSAVLAALVLLNLPFYRFMSGHAGPAAAGGCLAVYFCEMAAASAAVLAGLALHLWGKARAAGAAASEKLRWLRKMFFSGPGSLPEQVTLFVTDRCDLKCGHCFYGRELNSGRAEFTTAELARALPSLGRFSFVSLTGGEPFLRDDLPEIARLLVEVNGVRRISIPTNGYRPQKVLELTGKLLEACRGRASVLVKVSLDGVGAAHDAIRGVAGSFDRAAETFAGLKLLRRRHGHLKAGVLLTASGLNEGSLPATAAYVMRELAPDVIGLNFARGAAAGADADNYARLYGEILRWLAENKKQSGFYYEFYRAYKSEISGLIGKIVETGKYPLTCRAGALTAVIDSSLDVYPCELLGEKMGSLRDFGYDFRELLLSGRAAGVRGHIAEGNCCCTHECNLQMNSFFDPARAARLLLGALGGKLGQGRSAAAPGALRGGEQA